MMKAWMKRLEGWVREDGKDIALGVFFLGLFALLVMIGDEEKNGSDPDPAAVAASDYAARVHYASGGTREWGTVCRLGDGYVSVDHVTRNGTPVVGPKTGVTASNAAYDWSLLGIDPMAYKPSDFSALVPGLDVMIAGFPARDLDGEMVPGRVYIEDHDRVLWWVELLPLPDGSPPEGAVGGQSGSCVLVDGQVVAVVQANSFSKIEGTTNTFVLVIPAATVFQQARGETRPQPLSAMPDPRPRPEIAHGRAALRPE